MSRLFQIHSYLTYWLDAVDEHSLHSPFFFDLYRNVIRADNTGQDIPAEKLRARLLQDQRTIEVNDPGAGSAYMKSKSRRIEAIARTSITPARFSRLYNRLIHYLDCKVVLELGTSFGINTLYLADKKDVIVSTFEGADTIAAIAHTTFEFAGAQNIRLIEGNINNTLPSFLLAPSKIDLALLDANHRYEPTKKYVEWLLPSMHAGSVMILDDIHTTPDMERAWQEARHHPLVYGSVDLYRCGILFFDPSLNKQHLVIWY